MSTVDRPQPRILPPLIAGQRLDQPTFHERYAAMPQSTRAELINGVVYMPSPLRNKHGETDRHVGGWLFLYKRSTPGVMSPANATTKLGIDSEPQPDGQLRIPAELGGQTRVENEYIVGAPELVVEIGNSSRSYDLNAKKSAYEKAGVLEYLFVGLEPEEIRWFVRRDGIFQENPPGQDGIHRSEVFPGLWLDARALFAEDLNGLIDALDRGLATPEHAAFVADLAARRS
jgi:Uma2 family endonuclease